MKKIIILIFLLPMIWSCQKDTLKDEFQQNVSLLSGQNNVHKCATDLMMAEKFKDPDYLREYNARMEKLKNISGTRSCSVVEHLPVAIHYTNVDAAGDFPCWRKMATDAVLLLNENYAGDNTEMHLWDDVMSASYPGVEKGETCFDFKIGTKNHPAGFGLNDGDLAVTFNVAEVTEDLVSTFVEGWSGYLNIVVDPNLNISGTSILGLSLIGNIGDGHPVMMNTGGFVTGAGCDGIAPIAEFDKGKTLCHEMGHCLSLKHIWGNPAEAGMSQCDEDDGITDTPDAVRANIGSGDYLLLNSCGTLDMSRNFMDYMDDDHIILFTEGQRNVMNDWVTNELSLVTDNTDAIESSSSPIPQNIVVSSLTSSSVVASWDPVFEAVGYRLSYRIGGPSGQVFKFNLNEPTIAATGLASGTYYDFYVQSYRANGELSEASPVNSFFTNTVGCVAPPSVNITDLTSTGVTVSWGEVESNTGYNLLYRLAGESVFTSIYLADESLTSSVLSPNTTYEFKLQTHCTGGTLSELGGLHSLTSPN